MNTDSRAELQEEPRPAGEWALGQDGLLASAFPRYEARRPQIDMCNLVEEVIADGGTALIEAGTGCIQGDAEIIINRGGIGKRYRLSEVVAKFNGESGSATSVARGGRHRWNLSIPTYVQREEDEVIRLGRLRAAWCSGVKTTFTVTTESGRQLRATAEHPFLTARGWLRLDELRAGDLVHVRGNQATTGRTSKPRYTGIYRMHAHPYAVHRSNGSAAVDRHRLVAEAGLNGLSYETYIERIHSGDVETLRFINPRTNEVHHKDSNTKNDLPSNLAVLEAAEHPRLHAEAGALRHVLYKRALEQVVSVERYGEEMTYDLEVEDDPHNFLANGFVVHNTGKSFAYLIPAILADRKVIVSTDTIQLQEQLVKKDLPLLARILEPILGRPVRFAIAKGRSNFFCERNTFEFLSSDLFAKEDFNLHRGLATEALTDFRDGSWDGDKSNLTLPVSDLAWSDLSGDDSCTGRQCEYGAACAYLKAKSRVEDADIIITNHHMYLLHHYLQEKTCGGVSILPEHAVWIADEAHTLADKACDVFGIEIGQNRPVSYARKVTKQAKALDLEIEVDLQKIQRVSEAFFNVWHAALGEQQRISAFLTEILELGESRLEELIAALDPIEVGLHGAARGLDPQEDKEKIYALKMLKEGHRSLVEGCKAIFDTEDPEYVSYVEISKNHRGMKTATLHRKPIETAPIFRRILETLDSTVFCSATLATGFGPGAWKATADDLGIDLTACRTMQVESPFDYPRQVFGYVPKSVPETRHPSYHTACAEEVIHILNYTQGRAFVLFTSIRDMKAVYELVNARVRFPLLLQGEKPKDLLIQEFKETQGSVLFGVKTFWTGVDIPGDALSCVVLVKLPFPQFGHPLVEARCERIKQRGGSDFMEYSLPRCIRDVLQGFGRLIRSKQDSGVFCILDSRMHSARYAKIICNALPNFPCVEKL